MVTDDCNMYQPKSGEDWEKEKVSEREVKEGKKMVA